MSSDVDVASSRSCFLAQTSPDIMGNGPMNPDVGGLALGIALIIYNFCVSIILLLLAHPSQSPPASQTTSIPLVGLLAHPQSQLPPTSPERNSSSIDICIEQDSDGEQGSLLHGCPSSALTTSHARAGSSHSSTSPVYPRSRSPLLLQLEEAGYSLTELSLSEASDEENTSTKITPGPIAVTTPTNSIDPFKGLLFAGPLRSPIMGLFFLNYSILLSTATTIGRDKLTLFEAHFAVAVTASPVSVYLVYKGFREVFHLYRLRPSSKAQLKANGPTAAALFLACALPFSWTALNAVVSYHPKAFKNSHYCKGLSFKDWLEYQVVSNFVGVLDVMGKRDLWNDIKSRYGLGVISLVALWVWGVYFMHHRSTVWVKTKEFNTTHSRWWRPFCYLQFSWRFLSIAWDEVSASHHWLSLLIICCFHWSWVLGIYRGIKPDASYDFSFGQASSALTTLPPLWVLIETGYSHIGELKQWTLKRTLTAIEEESRFFLTRRSNSLSSSVETSKSSDALKYLSLIVVIGINGGFVYFVHLYVQSGTQPNIRTIVNTPHKIWKPFSVSLYVAGFLVGCMNVEVSFWCYKATQSKKWLNPYQFMFRWFFLLPAAVLICAAPLFSPFLALALAQERAWDKACSSFAGRAQLEGRAYISQPSEAYIHFGGDIRLDYILTRQDNSDPNHWSFDLRNTTAEMEGLADLAPIVQSVAYDFKKNTISATCITPNTSTPTPCMWGHFGLHDHFTFFLNDTLTNAQINLRAQDKEWNYPDDAPSFRLEYAEPGSGPVMETAVTKRNHCESLMICLSSKKPGLEILAPLGLALWAEDAFSSYCTKAGLVI